MKGGYIKFVVVMKGEKQFNVQLIIKKTLDKCSCLNAQSLTKTLDFVRSEKRAKPTTWPDEANEVALRSGAFSFAE